jgi:DNA-binding Lrp family transcriptional regulator
MLGAGAGPGDPLYGTRGVSLDATDHAILRALRDDGRMSMTTLADQIHVSRANLYARIERLHANGVILGYSARIDPHRVGLPVTALIMIGVDQSQLDQLRSGLLEMPEVEYFAFTAGEHDGVVLVRVQSIEALRDLIVARLPGLPAISHTQTVLVVEESRHRTPLP